MHNITARFHVRQARGGQVPRAIQIHPHGFVELIKSNILKTVRVRPAGAIYQDMRRSYHFQAFAYRLIHLPWVADIQSDLIESLVRGNAACC
jgi:hypothetical protein